MRTSSWTFFQAFLKSPRVVASLVPSSSFLERRLVRAANLGDAAVIMELGAGTGGTTRALLGAMRPDARLLAIERTESFVAPLRQIDDPRLTVINGCASSLVRELQQRDLAGADVVISGIPFSTLPSALARTVVEEVHRALNPNGRFVAYQFTDRVADYARPIMGRPDVQLELVNVPPLKIFTWVKEGPSYAVA